jgi:acetyl-CoA C-acetyltransferase
MGEFAQDVANEYQFTRIEQDEYALRSLDRAKKAISSGGFVKEITPVKVVGKTGDISIDIDEQPGNAKPEKIPNLKPTFAKDGTITAASSASISDGAAALVMTRSSVAEKLGLNVVARVVAHSAHAHEPAKFVTAPVYAIRKLLEKTGWKASEVDLFEVNEAFAVVAMITAKEIGIPPEKLNVNGGATALGHPIGASGTRIIATLIAALENRGGKRGIASLCIGGGEATAFAVELV